VSVVVCMREKCGGAEERAESTYCQMEDERGVKDRAVPLTFDPSWDRVWSTGNGNNLWHAQINGQAKTNGDTNTMEIS